MKQYSVCSGKAGKILFGLYLMAMLFLSRDTLTASCLIGFTKSQILMFGLILLLGLLFLWQNRNHLMQMILDSYLRNT